MEKKTEDNVKVDANSKDELRKEAGEKIAAFLAKQLSKKVEEITMDKRVVEDLGADSLDVVEMLMVLEEMFNVSISDEQAVKMKTVGEVVDYVVNNIKVN
jgi:acyl carrier protein